MLKVFAGEVLTAFQRQALYRALTTRRTIPYGELISPYVKHLLNCWKLPRGQSAAKPDLAAGTFNDYHGSE